MDLGVTIYNIHNVFLFVVRNDDTKLVLNVENIIKLKLQYNQWQIYTFSAKGLGPGQGVGIFF